MAIERRNTMTPARRDERLAANDLVGCFEKSKENVYHYRDNCTTYGSALVDAAVTTRREAEADGRTACSLCRADATREIIAQLLDETLWTVLDRVCRHVLVVPGASSSTLIHLPLADSDGGSDADATTPGCNEHPGGNPQSDHRPKELAVFPPGYKDVCQNCTDIVIGPDRLRAMAGVPSYYGGSEVER